MTDEKSTSPLNLINGDQVSKLQKVETGYTLTIHNFSETKFSTPIKSQLKRLKINIGKYQISFSHADEYYQLSVTFYWNGNKRELASLNDFSVKTELSNSSDQQLLLKTKEVCYLQDDSINNIRLFKISTNEFCSHYKPQLLNDVLIIKVTMQQSYRVTNSFDDPAIEKKSFASDISSLLRSGEFSDVTIKIDDKVYNLHKNILACRSKVFKAMLTTKMKEEESDEIIIKEMTPKVFEKLLFFIYSDRLSDVSDASLELCNAADMYGLLDLRKLCENEMEKMISCENVLAIFNYADSVNHERLKEQTVAFIVNNKDDFSNDDLTCIRKNKSFVELLLKYYNI